MESLSKGEFLSFLYSEKSRELENNSSPGWSLWAIWGIIFSIILFIYDKIKHYELDLNVIVLYFVVSLSWLLMIVHWPFYYKKSRLYSHAKLRKLREEAPISLYIIRSVLTLIGLCISISQQFEWYCIILWAVTCLINIYVIGYIYFHRNKIVNAGLKINVFSKSKYDLLVNGILILTYAILLGIQYYYVRDLGFKWNEFEMVMSILSIIMCCCILINLAQRNKIAEGIDYIIEAFTGGFINQNEAYKKYTHLVYGMDVSQIFDDKIKKISSINERYEPIKRDLLKIKTKIENEDISISDLKEITKFLSKQISYVISLTKTTQKLIKRNKDIIKLDIPYIVIKDLSSELKDLEKSAMLLDKTYNLISQVQKQLNIYINNNLYCRKTNGICEQRNCKYRNDPISWKYKLRLKIYRILHK